MAGSDLREWVGHDVVDDTGSKIGEVRDVYVDTDSGRPEWVAVSTGWFGSHVSFIPLQGLEAFEDVLVSPWEKDRVKEAPHADPDGELSHEEEARLYRHYGVGNGRKGATSEQVRGTTTKGRDEDDAMTRSEERLRVATEAHETGRVRLRKWVETEHRNVTVPIRKEKARIEREPITDENRDEAMRGPDISESEHEIVLTEERPVVDTEVVPKERVRLEKDVDVENESVGADLRKERIGVEGDGERIER